MKRLLHAVFNEPLSEAEWDKVAALNFDGVRVDCMSTFTTEGHEALIVPALKRNLWVLAVISAPGQAHMLPYGTAAVEVLNEPDVGSHPGARLTPEQYGTLVQSVHEAVKMSSNANMTVFAGAISNLNIRALAYLRAAISYFPFQVGVSFHRYPESTGASAPHAGFASREAEVAALRALTGSRRLLHSEGGYHTAPQKLRYGPFGMLCKTVKWSDEDVRRFWEYEWNFWRAQGVEAATIYQIHDGPDPMKGIDRYGIFDSSGSPKPVISTI